MKSIDEVKKIIFENALSHFPELMMRITLSEFGLEDFLNCIVMECIVRKTYKEEKKSPLYANVEKDKDNTDAIVHQRHRMFQTIQSERKERKINLKEKYDIEAPALEELSKVPLRKRREGYSLTDIQHLNLDTREQLPILKKIKKGNMLYKNYKFDDFINDLKEYDDFVKKCISVEDGKDYILNVVNLYLMEWSYCIELVYAFCNYMEDNFIDEAPIGRVNTLCGIIKVGGQPILTENRFVKSRKKLINMIFDDNQYEFLQYTIAACLSAKLYLFQHADFDNTTLEEYFCENVTDEEIIRFLNNSYNWKDVFEEKTWTRKKAALFKQICNDIKLKKNKE